MFSFIFVAESLDPLRRTTSTRPSPSRARAQEIITPLMTTTTKARKKTTAVTSRTRPRLKSRWALPVINPYEKTASFGLSQPGLACAAGLKLYFPLHYSHRAAPAGSGVSFRLVVPGSVPPR